MHRVNFERMSGQHRVPSLSPLLKERSEKLFLKNNNQPIKHTTVFKSRHLSIACSYLCCAGSFWTISTPFSPCCIRFCQLTWLAISSAPLSQRVCPSKKPHLFSRFHLQTHSCGLQIARDSICATEMSRAILILIGGWDGTLCLLKEDLWLPCNSCKIHSCLSEFLRGGRGFKGSR